MRNGVTSKTKDGFIVGPGAVYRDFVSPASPGTLIGATAGGNMVRYSRTIFAPSIDGVSGPLMEAARITEANAEIEVNFIEVTKDTLMLALSGATIAAAGATHNRISGGLDISVGNFISAIAIVGDRSGTTNPVCFVVNNALSTDPMEIALNDGKGGVGLKVKFQGYYTTASPTVVPWDIYYPV